MAERPPPFIGVAPLVIGALLVLTGVLRPALLWGTGKVETGRSWFGENGMAIGFIGFGSLLAVVGAAALLRGGRP